MAARPACRIAPQEPRMRRGIPQCSTWGCRPPLGAAGTDQASAASASYEKRCQGNRFHTVTGAFVVPATRARLERPRVVGGCGGCWLATASRLVPRPNVPATARVQQSMTSTGCRLGSPRLADASGWPVRLMLAGGHTARAVLDTGQGHPRTASDRDERGSGAVGPDVPLSRGEGASWEAGCGTVRREGSHPPSETPTQPTHARPPYGPRSTPGRAPFGGPTRWSRSAARWETRTGPGLVIA